MAQTQVTTDSPLAVKVYSASGSIEPRRANAFIDKKKLTRKKRRPQANELYRGPRKEGLY